MPIHIALLRGINVGGRNRVPMSDLLQMVTDLGFDDARSFLNSGNLLFASDERDGPALAQQLEVATEKRFGFAVSYIVRSAAEWDRIIDRNPFPQEAKSDPSHLLVMCLKDSVGAAKIKALQVAINGPEKVHADGKQLYLTYPAGIGDSKLTNTVIEQKLGVRGTARNWNTVLKLAALAQANDKKKG